MLRQDFSLTKRHLGLILFIAGGLGVIGLLGLDVVADLLQRGGSDLVSPDRVSGIGPQQALALAACLLVTLVGASLIPLGKTEPVRRVQPQPVKLPRGWDALTRGLLALVVVAMVAYFAIYVVYAANLLAFPFDYDQGEGFELVDTVMFSQFQWPYQDTETFPFYSSNYPPLFHVILAPFVWLFGPAYWYGRLLGFLGTLITAGAIGYAVYREEQHRTIAVISGLAYLASNYIYHVGPLFRQHLFMVMFEALAVVVLANAHHVEDTARRRRILAAGIALLLAAGYTKQLALATCVAVFVYLFLYNPRRSLTWGVMFAALAGGIFLIINATTGGQWWLNIIAANVNPFVPGQFEGLLRQWFSLHGVLIILAGLLVIYELYFAEISIYSVWFGAAVLNTILAGKWGAGDSYFATSIAAACILSGIVAARTLRGTWHVPENYLTRRLEPLRQALRARRAVLIGVGRVVIPVLYVLYAVAVFHMPTSGPVFGAVAEAFNIEPNTGFDFYDSAGWTVGYAVLGQLPTEEDIANGWRLVEIAAEGDAPAISEDAAFSLLADKPVIANPTQLRNLYNNSLYDPSTLNAMIEEQAFGVLILRALFYPDPVLFTMMQAYDADDVIPMNGFEYVVFRPDLTWPDRRALRDDVFALADGAVVAHVIAPPDDPVALWLETIFGQAGWVLAEDWQAGEAVFAREDAQAVVHVAAAADNLLAVTITHVP